MVGPNTFLDNSNSIKNLSVMAFKGRNSFIQWVFSFLGRPSLQKLNSSFLKWKTNISFYPYPIYLVSRHFSDSSFYLCCNKYLYFELFLLIKGNFSSVRNTYRAGRSKWFLFFCGGGSFFHKMHYKNEKFFFLE
jgi:hypothetical protein